MKSPLKEPTEHASPCKDLNAESESEKIRREIANLKINMPPPQAPRPKPEERTILILRDLPPEASAHDILSLFPLSAADAEASPARSEVLSVQNEFASNWSLRFESEERCVAAALFLRGKKLLGADVHCRVVHRPPQMAEQSAQVPPEMLSGAVPPERSPPGLSPFMTRYAESQPIFYSGPSSSLSPILSPTPTENILENVWVPEGVFGEAGAPSAFTAPPFGQSIPVSPMCSILGAGSPSAPSFDITEYNTSNESERAQKQYKQMLKIQQKSLEKSKTTFFPSNMVKSIPKNKVAALLAALSKQTFSPPPGFVSPSGQPLYFAQVVPTPVVNYGAAFKINNPNTAKIQNLD